MPAPAVLDDELALARALAQLARVLEEQVRLLLVELLVDDEVVRVDLRATLDQIEEERRGRTSSMVYGSLK